MLVPCIWAESETTWWWPNCLNMLAWMVTVTLGVPLCLWLTMPITYDARRLQVCMTGNIIQTLSCTHSACFVVTTWHQRNARWLNCTVWRVIHQSELFSCRFLPRTSLFWERLLIVVVTANCLHQMSLKAGLVEDKLLKKLANNSDAVVSSVFLVCISVTVCVHFIEWVYF